MEPKITLPNYLREIGWRTTELEQRQVRLEVEINRILKAREYSHKTKNNTTTYNQALQWPKE